MSTVTCVGVTQQIDMFPETTEGLNNPEAFMVYMARVSNPSSQTAGLNPIGLLTYCIKHKHWSVFDMVDMVVEIICPRDVSRQIIRHTSLKVQEFSQRYAEVDTATSVLRECRMQDSKNRQNSTPVDPEGYVAREWASQQEMLLRAIHYSYKWAIDKGIAREVARAVLPEGLTYSRMYVKGSVRSWIHYCEVRRAAGTQKEHREVADLVWSCFKEQFPATARAVEDNIPRSETPEPKHY